jgi:membrane protease YdiL (CAAX protease family)
MNFLIGLFWNREQRRLRALYRILLWGIILAVLSGLSQIPLVLFATSPGNGAGNSAIIPAASMAALLLAIVLATALAGRLLDRRPFRGFGFHFSRRWWIDFAFGLILGAGLMTAIFLVELAAGWVSVTGTFAPAGSSFTGELWVAVVVFLCVGIEEELTTRGYLLRNLAEGLNFRSIGPRGALAAAYLVSSLIFGLLHVANPHTSWISTLNLALAGLFLGLGFVLTGELAIPIGLHISWNFFQGNVFGFPVSGTDAGPTFVAIQQRGSEWVTGGAFGPEAGVIGLAALVLGSLLILWWVRRSPPLRLHRELADYGKGTAEPVIEQGKAELPSESLAD